MTMVARDSAHFGVAQWGSARFDVYTSEWEQAFNSLQREVTRRVACWNVDRDTTTGWRVPTFDDQTISGVLVEQGGSMPSFAVGLAVRMDAVLLTLDGVQTLDQVYDGEFDRYYEVAQIEEHKDAGGGFAFRACHLHLLELYKEA